MHDRLQKMENGELKMENRFLFRFWNKKDKKIQEWKELPFSACSCGDEILQMFDITEI